MAQIKGNRHDKIALIAVFSQHMGHMVYYEKVYLLYLLRLLESRNKNPWRDHPADRIDPPGQSLNARQLPRKRADNRLVIYLYPAILQCLVYIF